MTRAQWLKKIKTFVPKWFWQNDLYQVAHFSGHAELAKELQEANQFFLDQTYISRAAGTYLDGLGTNRGIERFTNETDNQYRVRVQNLSDQSSIPAIKALVDALLINGEATIIEDHNSTVFMDREHFMDRGHYLITRIVNAFTIVVPKQQTTPGVIADRSTFLDREYYLTSDDNIDQMFEVLGQAVDQNKAFGVVYRVIEETE